MGNFSNRRRHVSGYTGRGALLLQHGNNVGGSPVAKELPKLLLVPRDLVLLYQLQEVRRGVAGKRGLGKVRIRREEVLGCGVKIGEVTAASTRDQDLLANARGMLEQENATATTGCMHGAEQTGSAGPHNEDVIVGAGVMVRYGRRARREPRLPKCVERQMLMSS